MISCCNDNPDYPPSSVSLSLCLKWHCSHSSSECFQEARSCLLSFISVWNTRLPKGRRGGQCKVITSHRDLDIEGNNSKVSQQRFCCLFMRKDKSRQRLLPAE